MTITESRNKGFTLIELLVVIAIIGILATLILVALGAARQRGRVARVQSDLEQYRILAETFADIPGGYSAGLAAETRDDTLLADITAQGATPSAGTPTATEFCVQATVLPGAPATADATCRDSTGNAFVGDGDAANAVTPNGLCTVANVCQ